MGFHPPHPAIAPQRGKRHGTASPHTNANEQDDSQHLRRDRPDSRARNAQAQHNDQDEVEPRIAKRHTDRHQCHQTGPPLIAAGIAMHAQHELDRQSEHSDQQIDMRHPRNRRLPATRQANHHPPGSEIGGDSEQRGGEGKSVRARKKTGGGFYIARTQISRQKARHSAANQGRDGNGRHDEGKGDADRRHGLSANEMAEKDRIDHVQQPVHHHDEDHRDCVFRE